MHDAVDTSGLWLFQLDPREYGETPPTFSRASPTAASASPRPTRRGRAGGYAIQGLGSLLVERVDGDFSNVVGLPVAETRLLLKGAGYAIA